MNSNRTGVTELATSLNVRGVPAWPPIGDWLTSAADQGKTSGLFKVPLDWGPPIQLIGEQAANPVWSPDGRFVVYSGVEVGTRFPLKAAAADGKPYDIPDVVLSRGANRFSFLPGRPVLVVLKGDVWHKNFWLIDLVTGRQRQLTNFSREFLISDFDVSPDGPRNHLQPPEGKLQHRPDQHTRALGQKSPFEVGAPSYRRFCFHSSSRM